MTKTEADDHERARADNQNVRRGTTTTRGLAPTTRTEKWDASVLRIRDVYPGTRILILPIPDPGSRIPDPKTATKER